VLRGGRRRFGAREHRVDLLGRHRQAQQQLLVGDRGAEALARAFQRERLDVAQFLRAGCERIRSSTAASGGAAGSPNCPSTIRSTSSGTFA